jgi:hypothetical protein
MTFDRILKHMAGLLVCFLAAVSLATASHGLAQDRGDYSLGEDNRLEMVVHILGEVKRPGKYRVRDGTNLIELFSEAGGPTEFSNLTSVTVARAEAAPLKNGQNGNSGPKDTQRIIKYDVKKYLKVNNIVPPPIMQPGDVVLVPTNSWRKWRNVATVIRDVAVVASAYFLYLRASKD